MKKYFTSLFILIICFSLSSQQSIKIRVTDYPPQYYQDSRGNWKGLDVELANALVKEAGMVPQFAPLPWSRALSDLKSGSLHIMTNLSKTEERSQFVNWIGPERTNKMVLVIKKENKKFQINSIDDLVRISKEKGIKFGIQSDIFYSEKFNKRLEEDADFAMYFDYVPKANLNVMKAQKSRILGFFEEEVPMVYKIKNDPDYRGLMIHDFYISEADVYFGVTKQLDPALHMRLEEAFRRLLKNKKLEKIQKKYTN